MDTPHTWKYYALWTVGILCAYAFLEPKALGFLFFGGLAAVIIAPLTQAWTAATDRASLR